MRIGCGESCYSSVYSYPKPVCMWNSVIEKKKIGRERDSNPRSHPCEQGGKRSDLFFSFSFFLGSPFHTYFLCIICFDCFTFFSFGWLVFVVHFLFLWLRFVSMATHLLPFALCLNLSAIPAWIEKAQFININSVCQAWHWLCWIGCGNDLTLLAKHALKCVFCGCTRAFPRVLDILIYITMIWVLLSKIIWILVDFINQLTSCSDMSLSINVSVFTRENVFLDSYVNNGIMPSGVLFQVFDVV